MNYEKLKFDDVDAYLVLSEHNRYYLSGFHSSFGIMAITKNTALYITDRRYDLACTTHFQGTGVEAKIVVANAEAEAYKAVCDLFTAENVKVIGFEDNMSVREFYGLQKTVKGEYVPKGAYIELLRSVKTDEEIEKIKKAMELSSKAFNDFLPNIKAGMTEKQLCAELNYQLFYNGADTLAFDTIVASGVNGSKPHAVPSDKIVQKGEMVTFDFGARLDGYCADITRTVAIGKIPEEQKHIYNVVLTAQKMGLGTISAGVTGKEVDSFVREYFKANGVDKQFVHSLGHGVGVEIHELPRLSPLAVDAVLENNMVVTCEPGLYFLEQYGVRIEDTVVVKDKGIINLCPLDKELITIKA